MPYHSNIERCHMVEALQAQARFCDELACACIDQTHDIACDPSRLVRFDSNQTSE